MIISDLPNTLHEFRTVGKNDEGSSPQSDPVEARPLPGVGRCKYLCRVSGGRGGYLLLKLSYLLCLLEITISYLVSLEMLKLRATLSCIEHKTSILLFYNNNNIF